MSPVAAATNDHRLKTTKNDCLTVLEVSKSEIQVRAGLAPGGSRGRIHFLAFCSYYRLLRSWVHGPSSIFTASRTGRLPLTPPLALLPPYVPYKDLMMILDNPGSSPILRSLTTLVEGNDSAGMGPWLRRRGKMVNSAKAEVRTCDPQESPKSLAGVWWAQDLHVALCAKSSPHSALSHVLATSGPHGLSQLSLNRQGQADTSKKTTAMFPHCGLRNSFAVQQESWWT